MTNSDINEDNLDLFTSSGRESMNLNLAYLRLIYFWIIQFNSVPMKCDKFSISFYTLRIECLRNLVDTASPKIPKEYEQLDQDIEKLDNAVEKMLCYDSDGQASRIQIPIASKLNRDIRGVYIKVLNTLENNKVLTFKTDDPRFAFGGFGA
jgi:hypothetical protein